MYPPHTQIQHNIAIQNSIQDRTACFIHCYKYLLMPFDGLYFHILAMLPIAFVSYKNDSRILAAS